MPIAVGACLDHYKLISPLGAGGMGEVYLAEDTKLSRKVALKLLPEAFTRSTERVRRFEQEARAASALNHPNIITIHEIDEANGAHFIATEFIDGQTLRERLKEKLAINAALDIAVQMASALAAAHEAGITHRDIKPENVMLRRDGIVKVLDFGLAKLTEQRPDAVNSEAPTIAKVNTDPGTVMGTASYMSPEQARGQEVDARSDIFSLGVVLYEMLAGRAPFTGVNALEVIGEILKTEPAPLKSLAPDAPAELQRIVSKALRKDREQRYQHVKDLLIDLKDLKQELEFEAKLKGVQAFAAPASSGSVEMNQTPSEGGTTNAQPAEAVTNEAAAAPSTSSDVDLAHKIQQHKLLVLAVLALFALALIGFALYGRAAKNKGDLDSIAVLPFDNQNRDPDSEYLSDGLTESIINNLAQIPSLRVAARNSVFRYKGKEVDPLVVGRELDVHAVLTGRLLQRGESLIVSVELVDTRNNRQAWGERYNRTVADALTVQQEISREIAAILRSKLTGQEQQRLAANAPHNPEAYQSYLKGLYHLQKRSPVHLKKAIEQFQQAVDQDPGYALAYAELANCYILLGGNPGYPVSEALLRARAYAQRALQINDALAEAHVSLGALHGASWQVGETEKEYRRAIELNPNYPTAYHWYSYHLRKLGRIDEALAASQRAYQLDPLAPAISTNLANDYLIKGDSQAALKQVQNALELDPDYRRGHITAGWIYLKLGSYSDALTAFNEANRLSQRSNEALGNLGYGLAVPGKRAEALAIIKELEGRCVKQEADGIYPAAVYAGLGEKDKAFAWLETDFQARRAELSEFTWWPPFDSLRGEARYSDLLRRMGLRQ